MRNIAMKIAVYVGLIILLVCVGLGLFAYNSGSSAVLAEVVFFPRLFDRAFI